MSDRKSSDDRITELETRLSFQEDTLQQLNDVTTRQDQLLQNLARKIDTLQAQLKTLAPSLIADSSQETPPPHY